MQGVLCSNKQRNKTWAFIAGLAVAVVGLVGGLTLGVHTASAAGDCTSNDIIYCGYSTASDFINKVRANDSHNGHHDLQAIYAHQFVSGQYLSPSMYSDFAAHAMPAKVYKNGKVVLSDGTVVATSTSSIGRDRSVQGSGPQAYPVGSTTYWGNTNDQAFASDPLDAYVLFDGQGTMQFAVLRSCGNPVFGHAVPTGASCRELTKAPVAGQLNTYNFTATANTAGNAQMKQYIFDFGDGTKKVVSSHDGSVTVQHQYVKGGTFTAKVTEIASVPGNDNLQLPVVSNCTKTITVVLPFYACESLKPITVDEQKRIYKYVATARNGGGAVFTKTEYNFGDNTAVQTVASTDHQTTTVTHTFAGNQDYNVSATLHFTLNGKDVTASYKCTANRETSTCKPGIPVGDVRCNPCPTNPALPADSPDCTTPETTLPNTGAGNTIAIFAAVVVAGFLAYRHMLFRRHKAAFLAAQRGISPLPLGDPLNDEAPLAGTPLAPKRRSFRRNRPF